jgi:hypothetical protein
LNKKSIEHKGKTEIPHAMGGGGGKKFLFIPLLLKSFSLVALAHCFLIQDSIIFPLLPLVASRRQVFLVFIHVNCDETFA